MVGFRVRLFRAGKTPSWKGAGEALIPSAAALVLDRYGPDTGHFGPVQGMGLGLEWLE